MKPTLTSSNKISEQQIDPLLSGSTSKISSNEQSMLSNGVSLGNTPTEDHPIYYTYGALWGVKTGVLRGVVGVVILRS